MPADVPTEVFHEWGKANGFTRSGTTLHREQADTIAVVNLQGSQDGGRSYLNVALWLKALGDAARPHENQCHIRTDWSSSQTKQPRQPLATCGLPCRMTSDGLLPRRCWTPS